MSKIRHLGDAALRTVCKPLTSENGLDSVEDLLLEMHETMTAEQGIGLAANQIGQCVRVFILKDGDSFKEFINPEIVSQMETVDFQGEGCLSIPGVSAPTKRFRRVNMTWTDRAGRTQEGEFLDMDAFAVQHEMDHLNGKLYIDQFGPVKKEMVVKKHKKFLKLRST